MKLNCSARIVVLAERGSPHVLRVTKFETVHTNHPETEDFVEFVPERRHLDPEEEEDAQQLIDVRGQLMVIAQNVRKKTGKKTTSRDISNQK